MIWDCHMHMILDGDYWKTAIARHSAVPDEAWIRGILQTYQRKGFTYLRDGGDRWGAGAKARELAPEYGITYRTLWRTCARRSITADSLEKPTGIFGSMRNLSGSTGKTVRILLRS